MTNVDGIIDLLIKEIRHKRLIKGTAIYHGKSYGDENVKVFYEEYTLVMFSKNTSMVRFSIWLEWYFQLYNNGVLVGFFSLFATKLTFQGFLVKLKRTLQFYKNVLKALSRTFL